MAKKIISIKGMHCNSCSNLIENSLKDKVNSVSVDYAKGKATIDFDENKISLKKIKEIIDEKGYCCLYGEEVIEKSNKNNFSIIPWIIIGISIAIFIYFIYGYIGKFEIPIPDIGENTSLILLFLAGLLTGFHCISMCGGFVISYTTKNALKGYKGINQHLIYGGAKVISYSIIGGIFGFIGGLFAFSIGLRGAIAIFAGLFMIFYSLSMMGIGFFRKFQINPKFLTRVAISTSKKAKGHYYGPLVTGLLTGLFIACGPLQAMYLYAAGTGSLINGFFSLAAFGLGTLPVMLGFGSLASVISKKATARILKISAIIVLILGLIMLNRGLSLI